MGLTNSDYEAVMREYDSIRYANAKLLKHRMNEIFNNIPEFKALEGHCLPHSDSAWSYSEFYQHFLHHPGRLFHFLTSS